MPHPLVERLRARGFVMPDYDGGGLLNVPATVLDVLGARDAGDAPPLVALDPKLREGVRQVVVILADGLGWWQLEMLCDQGHMPFLAELRERARRRDGAQLIEATTVFPSTTAAAITTMNTARSPLAHGNIAYFVWLEEFAEVTQMLRWGSAIARRGSYFDDPAVDPLRFVLVPSIHRRLRERLQSHRESISTRCRKSHPRTIPATRSTAATTRALVLQARLPRAMSAKALRSH